MTDLAIHTQGLGKRFGERAALEHIDLEVPRGCAFGFLGPNGAGKTTLIRLLLGLARPTIGTIRLLDQPDRSKALARVGAIVEEPRFHRHLTGRENLHVHAAARDKSAHSRVDAALQRVGLAALTGSRGTVIGLALAFQLGVSPILAQVEAIGDARYGIPSVAIARIGGVDELEFALATAIAIVLAWAAAALAAGAWRSATQEI